MRSTMVTLALLVLGGIAFSAQASPAQSEIAFEAVSIRLRNPAAERILPLPSSPNRFVRATTTVRRLLTFAFDVLPAQIIGGPEWIDADSYQVNAVANAAVPPLQMRVLVQRMLADRFNLKTHRETRELPVLMLTQARRDNRLGASVRRSDVDCAAVRAAIPAGDASPAAADVKRCRAGFGITRGIFTRQFRGESMAGFAQALAADVGRVVLDRTGLAGTFDFDFAVGAEHLPGLSPPAEFLAPPGQDTGPALDTALRDQLGLRVESSRGSVEVLVIDSVERPAPD